MSAAARLALACLLTMAVVRPAAAQTPARSTPSPVGGKQIEISAGLVVFLPMDMGSRAITLPTASGGAFIIAQESDRIGTSAGIQAQIGFRLIGKLRVAAGGSWSRLRFQSAITGDVEGAAAASPSLSVSRFTAGGDVVLPLQQAARHEIFVLGGVNWLRESSSLSAGALIKDGSLIDAGAGVKLWLNDRAKGRIKRVGVQLEGRFGVRTGGITLDNKNVHVAPSFIASFVFGT